MRNLLLFFGVSLILAFYFLFSSNIEMAREIASNSNASRKLSDKKTVKNPFSVVNLIKSNSEDPRSEYINENKEKEQALLTIIESISRGNTNLNEEVLNRARKNLMISDGHIKKAALVILSMGEKSEGSFDSIIRNVLNYHDRKLVDMGLAELSRYKNEGYFGKIHQTIINVISTGSIFAKNEVAKKAYLFITKDTYDEYLGLLQSLSKNSRTRVFLKASLEQYKMSLRGG